MNEVMPTYEYQCEKCGRTLEIFQKITEPPRKRCPECRGALRRVLSAGAGIIFKGSGFYATDYRSESYRKAAGSEKAAGPEKKESGGAKAPESSSAAAGARKKDGNG